MVSLKEKNITDIKFTIEKNIEDNVIIWCEDYLYASYRFPSNYKKNDNIL